MLALGPLATNLLAQDDAAAESDSIGFLGIVFSGGIVGAILIFVLLALSLTAAYLVFDHLMTIRRKDLMPDGLSEQVRELLLQGDVAAAREACNAQPSFLSFVLLHGISELEFGWASVENHWKMRSPNSRHGCFAKSNISP